MTLKLFQSAWSRVSIVALSLVLTACSTSSYPKRSPEKLTAVVDAGSSGSRIFLYKTTPDGAFVQIKQLFTNKNVPNGLSWFDNTQGTDSAPGKAGALGIQPLLTALKTYLDHNGIRHNQVSVSVLGTAGMRMVDADTSSAIYQSVRNTITSNGFTVQQLGTLTGQNEGLYAWADVNYLAGNFKAGKVTQGIIEVGGASSQVAFVTSSRQDPNVVSPIINGVHYPVYSVSYPGLGLNQARLAMLRDDASGGVNASVCYPNNATGSPSTYQADAGHISISISPTGSRFSPACRGVYAKVIANVTSSTGSPHANLRGSFPSDFNTTQFLGLSAIYNVLRDWGEHTASRSAQSFEEKIARTCAGSNAWPRVLAQYKDVPSVFSQNACANASFLDAYLYSQQSLGILPAQLSGVSAINGSELTWTRGFLVIDTAP